MEQNQKTARQKAEELTSWYMNNRSAKMSDDSRIELPTAKEFARKTVKEVLSLAFFGDMKLYNYYLDVLGEIDNL